jgi:hypothetical protein
MIKTKISIILFFAFVVSGCGGGSDLLGIDLYKYYGAIAIN